MNMSVGEHRMPPAERADMAAKAEQQRKTAILAALDGMDMAHRAETWERDLDAGKAWAYAGPPAALAAVLARLKALLATPKQPPTWPLPVEQADLRTIIAELEARQL